MAQLSRPYQLGLLGVVVLAAAWLVLLQSHSSTPSSSGAGASAPIVQTVTTTTTTRTAKHSASGGSKVYHGSAPGVSGLTKAITKAQGAAATAQQNANTLERKSAQASNESAATTHTTSSPAAAAPAKAVAKAPTSTAKSTPTSAAKATPAKPTKSAAPNASTRSTIAVNQRIVEAQLAKGRIAVILFWDPRGADDVAVHRAVQQLSGNSRLKIAVSYAKAAQVASYGTITRGIQVYGTPTILVVNKKGTTTTLTGLQDSFAIQQAVSEARHG